MLCPNHRLMTAPPHTTNPVTAYGPKVFLGYQYTVKTAGRKVSGKKKGKKERKKEWEKEKVRKRKGKRKTTSGNYIHSSPCSRPPP